MLIQVTCSIDCVFGLTEALEQLHLPSYLTKEPPSVYHWLYNYLRGLPTQPFPFLPNVSTKTKCAIVVSTQTYLKSNSLI